MIVKTSTALDSLVKCLYEGLHADIILEGVPVPLFFSFSLQLQHFFGVLGIFLDQLGVTHFVPVFFIILIGEGLEIYIFAARIPTSVENVVLASPRMRLL